MTTFTPPTIEEGPLGEGPLLSRYKLTRGITVLKNAGVYTQVRYPTDVQVASADICYLGGHDYPVSATEAAALVAAGYQVNPHTNLYGDGLYDSAVYA